jgi:hypothetical protein
MNKDTWEMEDYRKMATMAQFRRWSELEAAGMPTRRHSIKNDC